MADRIYDLFFFLIAYFCERLRTDFGAINSMLEGLETDIRYMLGMTACFVILSMVFAFLKKADILLLDESTSALDAVTEQAISRALYDNSANCTILLIAHRLATVREADRIKN